MQTVQGTFKERLVDFSAYCRERQFVVSPQQTEEAFRTVELGYAMNRKLFHNCLKTIYCKRKEHFDRFDELFIRFWSRHYEEKLEGRKVKVKAKDDSSAQSSIVFLGAKFNNNKEAKEEEAKKTAGANQTTRLRYTDFSKFKVSDKEELEALAEELFHQMSMRFKRRMQKANQGKVDVQKTIRKSISTGGWMMDLSQKRKKKESAKWCSCWILVALWTLIVFTC